MADRKEVLQELEDEISKAERYDNEWNDCVPVWVLRGAHELLKEQEAIPVDTKAVGIFNGDMEVYCCRDCRTILDPAFHYCPNCGRAVKWDD
jgi:hypothetical protein